MATNPRRHRGGAHVTDEGVLVVPRARIKPFERNPRDPTDFDYESSPAFRSLVDSIDANGVLNPLQVFWHDNMYQLIAGHRRLAAVEFLEQRARTQGSETGTQGPEPNNRFKHLPAVVQEGAKDSAYQRYLAMFNDEETTQPWPEVRRFSFFADVLEAAPADVRTNPRLLARETGMRPTTVKTYLQLLSNPVIASAMKEPSEDQLPRTGRMKALRAVYRMVMDLTDERAPVVQHVTGENDIKSKEAQSGLANCLITKLRHYDSNPGLAVGPGVAIERTVPFVNPLHDAAVSDADFVAWLQDESILRPDLVNQRITRSGQHPTISQIQNTIQELLYVQPGRMDTPDLQAYCDGLESTAHLLQEEADKARISLNRQLDL